MRRPALKTADCGRFGRNDVKSGKYCETRFLSKFGLSYPFKLDYGTVVLLRPCLLERYANILVCILKKNDKQSTGEEEEMYNNPRCL